MVAISISPFPLSPIANIILRAKENAKQLQITAEENSKKFISRQEEQIKQKIKAAEKQALLDVKNLVVDLSVEATKEYLKQQEENKPKTYIFFFNKSFKIYWRVVNSHSSKII